MEQPRFPFIFETEMSSYTIRVPTRNSIVITSKEKKFTSFVLFRNHSNFFRSMISTIPVKWTQILRSHYIISRPGLPHCDEDKIPRVPNFFYLCFQHQTNMYNYKFNSTWNGFLWNNVIPTENLLERPKHYSNTPSQRRYSPWFFTKFSVL